jgi:hypothetical protein
MKQNRKDQLSKLAEWLNSNGHLSREQQADAIKVNLKTLYWTIVQARKAGIIVREQSRAGTLTIPEPSAPPARQAPLRELSRQDQLLPPDFQPSR